MGFEAGSDVFVQRTGMLLDLSLPSRPSGILLMPLPRTFGVFSGPAAGGGSRIGGVTSLLDAGGSGIEGFLSVSEGEADNPREEWLLQRPLFPGGRILNGVVRVVLASSGFAMTTSVGSSSCDRYPPGLFAHAHFAVRAQGFSVYILFAQADRTYVSPSGEPCLDLSRLSFAMVLSNAAGSLDCRFSRSLRGLPFSPGESREHRDEASLAVERRLVDLASFSLTARLEGAWTIHEYGDGETVEDVRWAALASARWAPLQFSVSVSRTPEETSASLSAGASLDRRGSSFGLKGTGTKQVRGGSTGISCSADAFCSFQRKNFTLTIEAGLENLNARGLRLAVSWSTRQ